MQQMDLQLLATSDALDDVMQSLEDQDCREDLASYLGNAPTLPVVQVQALLAIAEVLEDISTTLDAISEKLQRDRMS